MSNINKSNTPKPEKDYWRTSPELVNDALKLLNIDMFDTDVCCTNELVSIAQCQAYITENTDALKEDITWHLDCFIKRPPKYSNSLLPLFCNPPFSLKYQFFQKAVEQVKRHGKQVLMVLPYTPCTKQWHDNVHSTDCIIYVPDGRYQFLLPDGSNPKSSCNFETCLVLIVPFKCGNVIVNYKRGLCE